ncbi:MAG: hypothetical protein WD314_15290 [Trueperaceae bacterium]
MKLESKRDSGYPAIGILLLALGALALLSQAGLFRSLGGLLGALLFGLAGLYLIRRHYREDRQVWSLCTGFALLGLGVAALPGPLSGAAFLAVTGVGFVAAYREDPRHSWAVIPAGILLTLAAVAGLDGLALPLATGPLLFLGPAATFWYLYRRPREKHRWALYPAVALLIVAVLSLSVGGGWLLPLALIAAGAYLVARYRDGRVDWQGTLDTVEVYGERLFVAAQVLIREVTGGKASTGGEDRQEPARPAGDVSGDAGDASREAGRAAGDRAAGEGAADEERPYR